MDDNKNNELDSFTERGKGLRYNKGKLRYDLVNPYAFEDMVQVLTDGANKYFPRNWENGLSWTSVLASLKRHIAAFEMCEDYDNETGRLHIAHAACNIHFLNTFYHTFPQGDDRVKKFLKCPKIGLDIDGVLADFMGAWHKIYPEINANPTTWYCDRDIQKRFEIMKENGSIDDFYLNIKPLIKPTDLPFEPHCYITSRPVSKEITEKWIDYNGFPAKKVISIDVRNSKVEVAKAEGIEIFIEDSYDNFIDLNNNGVFCYLLTTPWNERYDVGHMRINSLSELPFFRK